MKKKTLIIVESPTKAHKIQEYVGDRYIVLSSKGHITDLAKGGKHGLGIDIQNNFKPKYVISDNKINILQELLSVGKDCENILLSSDPDREGESISWHLAERLRDLDKPMKRIVFNKITKSDILKAIKNPREIDENLFHAQEARRILDRLVGFMASPFLMNFFGNNLSAGRVQSVVTRLVIDREKEITSFIPEDYWTIHTTLEKNNESFVMKYSGRLADQTSADNMYKILSDKNAEYIVSEVSAEEEKKYPQPPLVTSTLQRLMSKQYGFGAERTMKAAQSLYECGHCTYIRTDSVRVGDEAITEVRQWLTDNSHNIPKKANTYKNKDAAQDAHECIRPANLDVLPNKNMEIIDSDEKKVYEAIWKYFVASQMLPAEYNTLKATAHIKGNKSAEVKASGKALKSEGYLTILGITDDSKIEIPNLVKGDILHLFGKNPIKMEQKQTQPPARYSEDKLIKELVNKNIGRPATYADLLSKITSRNYVEKRGNIYYATELGSKITNILKEYFTFMDYDYTATMETQLDQIESGKLNHVDMLKKFYPQFKLELDKAYLNYGGSLCEKCERPMITRKTKTGSSFLGCSAYPNCNNTKNLN